jgi:hypothetical protein
MMNLHSGKPEHQVAYNDLCMLIGKHASKVSPLEMLAIASNMVGKLVAMQDQRIVTPKMAMELVAKNIDEGNNQALVEINQTIGGRQ